MATSAAIQVKVRPVNPQALNLGVVSDWTRITPRHLGMIKNIPGIVRDQVEVFGCVHISNKALEFAMQSIASNDLVYVRGTDCCISGTSKVSLVMDTISKHLSKGGLASVKLDRLMDGTGADLMSGEDQVSLTFELAMEDRQLVGEYDIPLSIKFDE